MKEYPKTRNALLYETKVSQRQNCDEIRKLFGNNRQIQRNYCLIIIGA